MILNDSFPIIGVYFLAIILIILVITTTKENKMAKEQRAYYDPEIKLTDDYLHNAIDEMQSMYSESFNIPDWLMDNLKTEGGFVPFAKAVQLQQVSILDFHDDEGENWNFEYFVHEEMIDEYNNNNKLINNNQGE